MSIRLEAKTPGVWANAISVRTTRQLTTPSGKHTGKFTGGTFSSETASNLRDAIDALISGDVSSVADEHVITLTTLVAGSAGNAIGMTVSEATRMELSGATFSDGADPAELAFDFDTDVAVPSGGLIAIINGGGVPAFVIDFEGNLSIKGDPGIDTEFTDMRAEATGAPTRQRVIVEGGIITSIVDE